MPSPPGSISSSYDQIARTREARGIRNYRLEAERKIGNRLQIKLPERLFVGQEQKTPKTIDATYREVVKPRR